MRKTEIWLAALLWAAATLLPPLAAIEPAACTDAGAYLALGFSSVSL
jgi:hypothetical protein